MKPPRDTVETVGEGPDLLLIHGTAADKTSWAALVRLLRGCCRITTYDRRGTRGWPLAADTEPPSVEEHAADAADIIRDYITGSAYVCGVSFGGAVALELVRQQPHLVRGAALFEPPLVRRDELAGLRSPFLVEFDRLVRAGNGEQAAELFQRRLLSDARWERMTDAMKEEARCAWRHIHCDLLASAAYRPRYSELGTIDIPVMLLQGGRSRPALKPTLRALAAALPRSRQQTIPSAAHRLEGQAWSELATALIELMAI
jgi:pimeloyl-ACP methyl ester carboxylesterase